MNNFDTLKQIEDDIGYINKLCPNYDKLEIGWENWKIGQKIGWLYKDEATFYQDEHNQDRETYPEVFEVWLKYMYGFPYEGILFTLPGLRFKIDENAIICIYDYPIEKDNPVCDWISLSKLLTSPDLYRIYKI